MILMLRDEYRNNLVDIEIFQGSDGYLECRSIIDVIPFSSKIMEYKDDFQQRETFIKSMYHFQEIREHFHTEKKNESYEELIRIKNIIQRMMIEAAKMFDLKYIED